MIQGDCLAVGLVVVFFHHPANFDLFKRVTTRCPHRLEAARQSLAGALEHEIGDELDEFDLLSKFWLLGSKLFKELLGKQHRTSCLFPLFLESYKSFIVSAVTTGRRQCTCERCSIEH